MAPGHPERELAALALQAGETSAPIRMRTGVHVLPLLARWEPGALSVAEVAEVQR